MNNIKKDIDELFDILKEKEEYKNYINVKKMLEENKEITDIIDKIKIYQKKYVKTHDKKIKEELNILNNKLNDYPIYSMYLIYKEDLENELLIIKDEFEKYFREILKLN